MEKSNLLRYLPKSKYEELIPALKSQKAQQFTTIVLTILAFCFFSLFAVTPTVTTILDLQKQVDDSDFVNQKLTEKIVNLNTLQRKYTELSTTIPLIFAAIPLTPNTNDFAGQIQALASDSNVTLAQFNITKIDLYSNKPPTLIPLGGTTLGTFDFSIEAHGSFIQLKTFMNSLAHFERIISIDSISINKPDEKKSDYTANIKGETYFKP